MRRVVLASVLASITLALPSCAAKSNSKLAIESQPGDSLWVKPANIAQQDLFYGPWGQQHAPDPDVKYTLVERKHTGINPGMTVRDPGRREWSVKIGHADGVDDEGPVEVTVSRLLSAAGYHQPPVYYLPSFELKDDFGTRTVAGGRFRLKMEALDEVGDWAWNGTAFENSRELRGLLTLLVMFNGTDLKPSNNSLYEYRREGRVERWFVARDVGAAFGDIRRMAPRKGHIDAFEDVPFILGVNNGYVDLAVVGWYRSLVENRITSADVKWACGLLAQLTDRQWQDAFRAGSFEPDIAARFIRALRAKVDEGLRL